MEQTTTKGATLLKVTGILMIIGGAISVVMSIIAVAGIAAIAYLSDGAVSMGMLYASGALMVVGSVAELIAGILGVANSKKPEKAKTCVVWGAIVAALSAAGRGNRTQRDRRRQLQRGIRRYGSCPARAVHHRRRTESDVILRRTCAWLRRQTVFFDSLTRAKQVCFA